MTTELTTYEVSKKDLQTLESAGIIPRGTPVAQVELFARVCNEKGLSPFSKQIYLIPRGGKYTHQTSIDGYRLIAERTGKYAGSDDYIFNEGLTQFDMIANDKKQPITATATVHKILPNGQTFPIKATATWGEYFPGDKLGVMWKKMPYLMLGKCAEALALRKAFPEALSGIYTNEEMQQADNNEISTVVEIANSNEDALAELKIKLSEFDDHKELDKVKVELRNEYVEKGINKKEATDLVSKRLEQIKEVENVSA